MLLEPRRVRVCGLGMSRKMKIRSLERRAQWTKRSQHQIQRCGGALSSPVLRLKVLSSKGFAHLEACFRNIKEPRTARAKRAFDAPLSCQDS